MFGNTMLCPTLIPAPEPGAVERVKRCGLFVASVVFCWLISGCTAAYNARTVNSPDWKYGATCHIRGSLGRSYLADTKKKVAVSIFALSPDAKRRSENEKKAASAAGGWSGDHNPGAIVIPTNTLLFRKEYRIKSSDLNWSSAWGEHQDLTIVFYDYGPGVEVPYASRNVAPKRLLRTMNYQFNPDLGIYFEAFPKK